MRQTIAFGIIFVLSMFLISGTAFGEDCENFAKNKQWDSNFKQMQSAIEQSDYSSALEYSNSLHEICTRSPILNYYSGKIYQKLGEDEKALLYFQKASDYTSEFETNPEFAKMIWYARYEAEHPVIVEDIGDSVKNYSALLWSGTAIGGAGVALLVTGAVLAFVDNYDKFPKMTDESGYYKHSYQISSRYSAGMALFGVGIGLTVAGAVMAGIGGYHYVQENRKVALNFDIHLNYAGIGLKF